MQQGTVLTIIFVDISKSTSLYETYGDVEAEKIVNHTLSIVTAMLAKYKGVLIKHIGDGIMGTIADPEGAVYAASEMQSAVRQDPVLLEKNIMIKVGLHYGEVLRKENDIFGDAVNIAARMVDMAKGDQIITTRALVEQLSAALAGSTRMLGQLRVKGKQAQMEIFEVIWQEKQADLTIMASHVPLAASSAPTVKLVMKYQGNHFQVTDKSRPFLMGRSSENDLVVSSAAVSRSHASIECRQGKFVLIDRSTNATYVQMESSEKFVVHREEMHLHGQGVISLGKDFPGEGNFLIHFECK